MRKILFGVLGIVIVSAASCGGSSEDSASQAALQQKADYWEIDQIEKNFHEATTTKDIDMMMSLYAPNATMTVGDGETASGLEEIQQFWLDRAVAFESQTDWISDHPAYKLEITVNGDRGTLHFECHYIDVETEQVASVTAADLDVARIDGGWLITNLIGGTSLLEA